MGTRSGAYELTHGCAPERVPIFYYRDKILVQRLYFDSNTTVTLQCAALVFLESVCCHDIVWLTIPWDPNKNFISDAYINNSITASRSMNAFRYFNDARFNFYKDEFAMHNFY